MRKKTDLNRLIAELEADSVIMRETASKNQRAMRRIDDGAEDELDWAALGYTIHNLYNAIENYFLRIAKFFENSLSADSWHRDLVYRMTIDIEDLRPAFLDRETADLVHELRAFRHIFRNLYQSRLDPVKINLVQSRIPEVLERFHAAHRMYVEKLKIIRDRLEE